MRQIKDFSSFQLSQKLTESKNSDPGLRKLFPGLPSDINQAMKYAKQRGIDYSIEIGEEDGEKFPRIVIDGLDYPLDVRGYKIEGSRQLDPEMISYSLKDFSKKNDLDAKIDLSNSYFRSWESWPTSPIKKFFDDNIDLIRNRIFKTEEVDYQNLPIYKKMIQAGFKDLTTPALQKRKSIVFSHPLLIDGYERNGKAGNGKISMSANGPIRYSGPHTLTHIIKNGKPLNNKANYEFSLQQAADILMFKTLKSAKAGDTVISQVKKMPTEEALANFKDLLVANLSADTWNKAFGNTDLFSEEDFKNIMTPEQYEDFVLLSKARSLMI